MQDILYFAVFVPNHVKGEFHTASGFNKTIIEKY